MPKQGGVPLAVVAALVLSPAVFLLGGSKGGQGQAAAPATSASAPASATSAVTVAIPYEPSAECTRGLLHPFIDFAATRDANLWATRDFDGEVSLAGASLEDALGHDVRIDAIIATVADPVDSGMSYRFDTELEGLSLGIERAVTKPDPACPGGECTCSPPYFRDRSWLPWDDREAAPDQRAALAACRRTTPGVVLFRNQGRDSSADAAPRAIALLLVGETPTSGIHVASMVSALRTARALRCLGAGKGRSGPVKIIGPTFSGSASSLKIALKEWASREMEAEDDGCGGPMSKFEPVSIVTASATGSALASSLNTESDPWLPGHDVTFSATVTPEAGSECAYFGFLVHHLGMSTKKRPDGSGTQVLPNVAMLHESGTEFGSDSASPAEKMPCGVVPAVDATFPLHVSSLRDAYEDIDRKNAAANPAIARATSLDISLREKSPPLDVESDPSPRTTYAEDVALSSMLDSVSHEGVQHVGIVATDIADAIFVARKIRDVAPDVRLAFFTSDALLLHPSFQRDLLGSLVIGPYPFRGSDDFAMADDREHRHVPFDNGAEEGAFNAALVVRGAPYTRLLEYAMTANPWPETALPSWIATIGREGLVPVSVHRTIDCNRTIYAGVPGCPGTPPLQFARLHAAAPDICRAGDLQASFRDFDLVTKAALHISSDSTPPKLWHFVYLALLLGFIVDAWRQRLGRARLSEEEMPAVFDQPTDRVADLAIGRTKWELYAAVRSFVLFVAIAYMSMIDLLVLVAYSPTSCTATVIILTLGVLVAAFAAVVVVRAIRQFWVDFWAFIKAVVATRGEATRRTTPSPRSIVLHAPDPRPTLGARILGRILPPLGFAEPLEAADVPFTSFAQLRLLTLCVLVTSLVFFAGLVLNTLLATHGLRNFPPLTLFVLRGVPLLNGVSPLAPVLLAMGCVYGWAVSRMARILDVHTVSRVSPPDGINDLVSTPIRLVLYPNYGCGQEPEGFTRTERAVLNSILRPCVGPGYLALLLALVLLPIVLGFLKPPSTLERWPETRMLFGALGLCSVIIGATVVQLLQYWGALSALLKRILAHPIRGAFVRVPLFARRSLDEQVSRAPDDLLRTAGSVQLFDELARSAKRAEIQMLPPHAADGFEASRVDLNELRRKALSSAASCQLQLASDDLAKLGQGTIAAASDVMRVLERAYDWNLGRDPVPKAATAESKADEPKVRTETKVLTAEPDDDAEEPPKAKKAPLVEDALAPVAWRFNAVERAWLYKAEDFVATVVTLLVDRHVRQFRYFLYGLTGCVLLLLLAFSSYAFEPHRLLLTSLWGLTGAVIVSGVFVFIQLDRNTLLSLISGTSPGKVTFDASFVLHLVTWVGLPLLGLAAAQYPEVANALAAVLEPFRRALH